MNNNYNIYEILQPENEYMEAELDLYISSYLKEMPYLLDTINYRQTIILTTFLISICSTNNNADIHKIRKYVTPFINFKTKNYQSIIEYIGIGVYNDLSYSIDFELPYYDFISFVQVEILKHLKCENSLLKFLYTHVDYDVEYNRIRMIDLIYRMKNDDIIHIIKRMNNYNLKKELHIVINQIKDDDLLHNINKKIPSLFNKTTTELDSALNTSKVLNINLFDLIDTIDHSSSMIPDLTID